MQSFRVYLLNPAIVRGEWFEAANDDDAMEKALELCDPSHPSVELWQGPRRLRALPCGLTQNAAARHA